MPNDTAGFPATSIKNDSVEIKNRDEDNRLILETCINFVVKSSTFCYIECANSFTNSLIK